MATDLPEEIMVSILYRVPVKSLLRFRCVSRSWCSLIADPLFISAHHKHQSTASDRRTVLVRRGDQPNDTNIRYTLNSDDKSLTEIDTFDFPLQNPSSFTRILGSVNGLVCLMSNVSTLILWNPAVHMFVILPASALIGTFGFGYDSLADDYKVVRVESVSGYVSIYRLSTNSWSMIDVNWEAQASVLPTLFPRQANLNGVVHWIGKDSTIVGFDFRIEKFRVLELPVDLKAKEMNNVGIAVWCGFLALFEMEESYDICLWIMNEYDMVDSWTKQCVIPCASLPSRVKSIRSNGEILVEKFNEFLFWFDPATLEIARQDDGQGFRFGDLSFFHMKPYTESLVLLDARYSDLRNQYDRSLLSQAPNSEETVDNYNSRMRLSGRWSHEEEKILISSWLNACNCFKDRSVIRNIDMLWKHIESEFGTRCQWGKPRGLSQLKKQWCKISRTVSKFDSCYYKLRKLHKGNSDENDIILKAYQVYRDEEDAHFSYEHAWRLLKDEPSWNPEGRGGEGCSKRAKVSETGAYITSSPNADCSDNAEKKKGKEKVADAVPQSTELSEMQVKMREMDLQIIYKDTSGMTEEQLGIHRRLLDGAIKRMEADLQCNGG